MPRHLFPLGFAGGSVDGDWYTLGVNLATFGVLGFGEEPTVYRSPGFPAYLALVLKLTVDPLTHTADAVNAIGPLAVLYAQSFLLGLSALLLYMWLSRRLSSLSAFTAALVFGANPYSLVTGTLIHYEVLHWAFLIAFLLVLEIGFERETPVDSAVFAAAGLLLAAGALVRPVSLLAPLPLLAVFALRREGQRRWIGYSSLVLGFILMLLPWTARNFAVTGRVIPVHAQGWSVAFCSTEGVLVRNPDIYDWNFVGRRYYLPLFRKVTGESELTTAAYARNVLSLEDAARAAAIQNIREKPHVYLANFLTAGRSLVFDINAVVLTTFVRLQTGAPFDVRWIYAGQRTNLVRGGEAHAFQLLHDLLLWFGLFGFGAAVWRKDAFLAAPVALFGAIVLAHALSYLDFYYYSVKIPFLVAFAFYGIDLLPKALRIASLAAILGLSSCLVWIMGFVS